MLFCMTLAYLMVITASYNYVWLYIAYLCLFIWPLSFALSFVQICLFFLYSVFGILEHIPILSCIKWSTFNQLVFVI